jgi:hypothetical protein
VICELLLELGATSHTLGDEERSGPWIKAWHLGFELCDLKTPQFCFLNLLGRSRSCRLLLLAAAFVVVKG